MPVVNSQQTVVRLPTPDGNVNTKTSNVVDKLLTASGSSSRLINVGMERELDIKTSLATTDVFGRWSSVSISKHTAKAVLSELVKLPKSENTYSTRLACLKVDNSIPTWQALTHDPEELKTLEQASRSDLAVRLTEPGVWLPEVESINTNVLMSLTTKLACEYAASFRSLLLDSTGVEKKNVSIVRGSPGAGKTLFLKGGFSLGGDEVKNYIQNRMPGLTMSQVHLHGSILLDRFISSMERKFEQGLTRDGLYLDPNIIEKKLETVCLQEGAQIAIVHDIQVDLTTLCCRMLKRSTDEALLGFDYLSQSFRFSLENRQRTIDLVQKNKDVISEYSLSVWDGSKSVKVAERSADSQDITIHDQALFEQHVSRDPVLIEAEIVRVGDTVIDGAFISDFTTRLEPAIAAVFTQALSQYDGKTMAEALELHRDRDHLATSVASRVLAEVVPA